MKEKDTNMKIGKVPIIAITALVLIGVTLAAASTGLLAAQKTTSSNGSKGYRKFRKNAKALSPVIATIILIAVTVTVSVVVAAWMGVLTIGFMGNGVGSGITSSVNIGVYTDEAATLNCTSIEWGTLTPGSAVDRTVYVENTGNTTETLSMSTSGWSPASASRYLTLTWNQVGTVLPAGSVVSATLTLTVASNTGNLTDFSFNIVISGSDTS